MLVLSNWAFGQTLEWSQKANPINNSINSVAFKSDGQQVMSGTNCHPASIRIFDVTDGSMEWDFTVGSNYMCIMGVTFSSNSNYLAAIEEFGNIFIFDNSGTSPVLVDTINTGTSWGFATAISPANDKVAVGCSNGKMKIYNLSDGTLAHDVNAHANWVTTLAYSPNGNFIVTGGSDELVKIWSSTGSLLFTCSGHTADIASVKITPDNNYVVSSSKDDLIKIWNISTGLLVRSISGHSNDVNGVDLSPDGTKIVSGSADGSCKIWEFSTGALISTFGVVDSGAVYTVAWSPVANKIVTGNALSDISLWDVSAALGNSTVENLASPIFELFPNPTSNFITIHLPAAANLTDVTLHDLQGRLLFQSAFPVQKIDVQQFAAGSYILSAKVNGKAVCSKFVKK